MKILLTTIVLVTFTFAGQSPTPRAIAKFCGNVVVHSKYAKLASRQIEAEGCSETRIVPLENDYILIYGIKEIIGESARQQRNYDTKSSGKP